MSIRSFRATSKIDHGMDERNTLTIDQINCGSFMRIADAVEVMSKRYSELLSQRDYFEKETIRLRGIRTKLARSNASLRGHLKRMKKAKQ